MQLTPTRNSSRNVPATLGAAVLWVCAMVVWPANTWIYTQDFGWSAIASIVAAAVALVVIFVVTAIMLVWSAAEGDKGNGSRWWLPWVILGVTFAIGLTLLVFKL